MAKRIQPMKEFGRSVKKPKLDITVSKSRPVASVNHQNPKNSVFWDDDDDDVILLATQQAEAAVVAEKSELELTMPETEIIFKDFSNQASTSTQKPLQNGNIFTQLLEDDDDKLLAVAAEDDVEVFKKPTTSLLRPLQSEGTQVNAKNQVVVATKQSEDLTEFVLSQTTPSFATLPASQSMARRQLASERQIKFLMEKVDALKNENSRLTKDLADNKGKLECQDGEASLLRDELRHVRQQMQNLKMEKIFSVEAAKNECQTKISHLSKRVELKETELRLKEVECSKIKIKYASETQKYQQNNTIQEIRNPTNKTMSNKREQQKFKMRNFHLHVIETCSIKDCLTPGFYEAALERGVWKKQRTLFQLELENIQTLTAQLQLLNADKLVECLVPKCINSACKVLPEFWSYCHSLEFSKNCLIYPYHDYTLKSSERTQMENIDNKNLLKPLQHYENEKVLSLRRYIAAMAVICKIVPALSLALIKCKHGEYYLLQITIEAVAKLGFSREICEHFGVLEALALLVNNILIHITSDLEDKYMELIISLLKHIVFTRPSPWIFREISSSLSYCAYHLPQAMDFFCINSPQSTFSADRVKSIYRFTNDSCLMQVYCGLLEIAFPLCSRLPKQHFMLLSDICLKHIRLAYRCFIKPPSFIHKHLPAYDDDYDDDDDDDDDDDEDVGKDQANSMSGRISMEVDSSENNTTPQTSAGSSNSNCHQTSKQTSENTCECYTKLCLSVVTLCYQLLRQWLLHQKKYLTPEIAKISNVATQLLHLIFCDNYLTCLFRDSEETTKHHLYLICKWLTMNSKILQLNDISLRFLEKLQTSHIMSRDITTESNIANIALDLSEWQKSSNDDVSHIKIANTEEEAEERAEKLKLIERAANEETYFVSLQGFAFDFH
uniref:ATR-interacting protein mus304 n=1 Tax=Glossina brevipalpis TaxID=37001 RepID=A0A1A9WAK1_9MUSC